MVDVFHSHIRSSLADANLQSALDANAEKRIKVRQDAFNSLANSQELRAQAHLVRADVIEHLDNYLEQFGEDSVGDCLTTRCQVDCQV
jgi:L-lactate utilization protein LutB